VHVHVRMEDCKTDFRILYPYDGSERPLNGNIWQI